MSHLSHAFNGRFNPMTTMGKVEARWSGFSGAPGYSNFFWQLPSSDDWTTQDGSDATGAVHAFFTMLAPLLPPSVKIDISADLELIASSNGELLDVMGGFSRAQITGSAAAGPYSAPTGAVVTWRTAGVRNGRRVRGRTFLVPLAGSAYENDGTLAAGSITTILAAANGMKDNSGTGDPVVWSRPSAVGATDGLAFAVGSVSVPDMGAVLRSRRS